MVTAEVASYDCFVDGAENLFEEWLERPAPRRADLVRNLANLLREHIEPLGELISLEAGKILSEGLGEVHEGVDMADLSVGMSRQLYGQTLHSERPAHLM